MTSLQYCFFSQPIFPPLAVVESTGAVAMFRHTLPQVQLWLGKAPEEAPEPVFRKSLTE
jgi:hypothetical protein